MQDFSILQKDEICCCQRLFETCDTLGNIKCTLNCLFRLMDSLMIDKWDDILSSKFLKIRHNFFADSFMSDNNIPVRGTDFCLRKIGIDSDLSPDIYLGEEDGVHKFIEFFVSGSSEIALQNKIEKYSKIEGISVQYIYYDYRIMKVMSDPEIEIDELGGLRRFHAFIRESYKIDRYLKYGSEEVEIPRLTPGKNMERVKQNIYYQRNFSEYTSEEYLKSIKTILNKLSSDPEGSKCSIHFNCRTRRFSVEPGKYDSFWLYDAVKNDDMMRSLIIYDEVDSISTEKYDTPDDNPITNTEGHTLKINLRMSQHMCLESAYHPSEIESQLRMMKFDGLTEQKLTPEIIKEIAVQFYNKWVDECSNIQTVKLKMTTMFPIPDIDRVNDLVVGRMYGAGEMNSYLLSMIPARSEEAEKNYQRANDSRSRELDKLVSESKMIVDELDSRMKSQRKVMIDRLGLNTTSIRIKEISDRMRLYIKQSSGLGWSVESIVEKMKSSNLNLSKSEIVYVTDMATKTKKMRNIRRIMKDKASRSNMFTMDGTHYKMFKNEKDIYLRQRKKGDERMGMNGYSGYIQFKDLVSLFEEFWRYLCEQTTPFDDWFSMECGPESFPDSTAGDQSRDYYAYYESTRSMYEKTRVYRVILWLSRLARSIWAISTYKLKKRRVIFDKFGTKSCFLFVTSTGNIQKYKSSKCFKIIIPISSKEKKFCGYDRLTGWEIMRDQQNNEYAASHWMYSKIEHLKYFMELPARWCQTMSCIMSEYSGKGINNDLCMYLTYCCLNARRCNENLLHDLKYMTYNLFGLRGSYRDLLHDKFEIPRDMLHRYIEEKFLKNIPKFADSLLKNQLYSASTFGSYPTYRLQHPLSNYESGLDFFNLYVYSSYIFPKGVFTQEMEQTKNMRSILEIHSKAMSILRGSRSYEDVKEKTDVEISRVFENDLFYNSGVVSAVGLYCEHYISSKGQNFDIRGSWASIVNKDITEYVNSHGLREDDLSKSSSWGKKGHDVMTKLISKEMPLSIPEEFEKTVPETIREVQKLKSKIIMTKYRICDYAKNHPIRSVELNNANKVQWGGSREIYIMTISAKNIQWSLEQLFAKISRSIDNELIHVPASDRFNMLYNSIKMPSNGVRYYLTLDCRKWAPLSNLNKYVIFINSMSGLLPKEFVEDFNYFYDLYYNKRLFFKKCDVENFFRVNNNSEYKEFFVEEGGAYYIRMPYSFMMGMFNYLSSILHAVGQLYFEDNIIPIIESSEKCKIKMKMFAHSDDSGGFVEISQSGDPEKVLDRVVKEYEAFQKCLNHMLSLKKCTISTSYFEITSYCFMKSDPMPVLPKFIYSSQINLTPNGYVSDVKSISSSVIEMLCNGSSFRTSFIKYICLGNLYRIMCLNRKMNFSSSKISIDLCGFPLIHPFYLAVYKSFAEAKWFSEFKDDTYSKNQSLLENMGMVDAWGRRVSMKMRMASMKERENDGRFKGYEILPEVPDEIIPSGHYACYMRKMSNKFYSDTMWYSMHDIDGLLIQSNMFNNGLSQLYTFFGIECGLTDLYDRVLSAYASSYDNSYKISLPEYIKNIDEYIKRNRRVSYRESESRSKPTELNTYYNMWWRNNMRETKIMALIKICPWMAVMVSNTLEYINCLESSENVEFGEIMRAASEEEPLMRIMMTTRAQYRIIDKFESIGSWMFYNSLPNMQPIGLREYKKQYNLEGGAVHPECIASLVFFTVCSGNVHNPSKIEIKEKIKEGEYRLTDAITFLSSKSSSDPVCMMVQGRVKSEWMNRIDFISMLNNQMSYSGSWVGRATGVCRISGREYEIQVRNRRVLKVKCKSRYDQKNIIKDISTIADYWFDYTPNVNSYKITKEERITRQPDGSWSWTTAGGGMPYYSDISLDPTISTRDKLEFVKNSRKDDKRKNQNQISWSADSLMYNHMGKKYKAFILNKKPCDDCLSKCFYKGANFKTGSREEYEISCSKEELVDRWLSTKTYELVHKEYKYQDLFQDYSDYCGQIGSILSAFYKGSPNNLDLNYFVDYRGELMMNSMTETKFPSELISEVRSHLGKYVRFRVKGGQIKVQSDPEQIRKLMAEYGESNVSTAMVLLPIERTVEYYTPMTFDDFWYNNKQVFPQFMSNFLRYIQSTIGLQPGTMEHKINIFKQIINEIPKFLTVSYVREQKLEYMAEIGVDMKLFWMLREFKDVGDPEDETIDNRFYYDPISIYGCISGWLRYVVVYSHKKMGKLEPDYKINYKKEYVSFLKKYKSFCRDSLQITPQMVPLTSVKFLSVPPLEYYKEDEENEGYVKPYPLNGCQYYEYSQYQDEFDEEKMTYDREESMLSYNYNPEEEYDYGNISIFYDDGVTKKISICSEDEAINWVPVLPYDGGGFKMARGMGMKRVIAYDRKFMLGWAGNPGTTQDYNRIITDAMDQEESNADLLTYMTEKLNNESKYEFKNEQFIKKGKTEIHSNLPMLYALLAKHSIFKFVFDEHGDLTPLIEGKNYENISNRSQMLNDNLFDQEAIAEMEKVSPGIMSDMETDTFRLTSERYETAKTLSSVYIFKNPAVKYTVKRIISSAVLVDREDNYCARTAKRILDILNLTGQKISAEVDDQMPDPSKTRRDYSRRTIRV